MHETPHSPWEVHLGCPVNILVHSDKAIAQQSHEPLKQSCSIVLNNSYLAASSFSQTAVRGTGFLHLLLLGIYCLSYAGSLALQHLDSGSRGRGSCSDVHALCSFEPFWHVTRVSLSPPSSTCLWVIVSKGKHNQICCVPGDIIKGFWKDMGWLLFLPRWKKGQAQTFMGGCWKHLAEEWGEPFSFQDQALKEEGEEGWERNLPFQGSLSHARARDRNDT